MSNGLLSKEKALLAALKESDRVTAFGCDVEPGDPYGVVIMRGGHGRAVWNYRRSLLWFTPGGYAEPAYAAMNVTEAVSLTVAYLTGLAAIRT